MRLSDNSPEYWFGLAALDEESAEILRRENGPIEISAYHYHQAAEKILKGAILRSSRAFPFIHDLQRLFSILMQSVDIPDETATAVVMLQAAYTKLRYPLGDRLTEHDLEILRTAFLAIKKAVYEGFIP